MEDLRTAAARVIAFADDADLAFIGRTPENFFDYLSGVFDGIEETPNLHLVQFSMRWAGPGGLKAIGQDKLSAFFDYLREEGVDAITISTNTRPLALVDFIAYGGTMQNFVEILQLQAKQDRVDWNAVQRRLKIIGLRVKTHNSPNTWRWQQHQDWLHKVPDTTIKNVSAPASLLFHIANDQPKLTPAFHPRRWGQDDRQEKNITQKQLEALALAVKLYDVGQSKEERGRLASLIARSDEMRQSETRRLVSRLNP